MNKQFIKQIIKEEYRKYLKECACQGQLEEIGSLNPAHLEREIEKLTQEMNQVYDELYYGRQQLGSGIGGRNYRYYKEQDEILTQKWLELKQKKDDMLAKLKSNQENPINEAEWDMGYHKHFGNELRGYNEAMYKRDDPMEDLADLNYSDFQDQSSRNMQDDYMRDSMDDLDEMFGSGMSDMGSGYKRDDEMYEGNLCEMCGQSHKRDEPSLMDNVEELYEYMTPEEIQEIIDEEVGSFVNEYDLDEAWYDKPAAWAKAAGKPFAKAAGAVGGALNKGVEKARKYGQDIKQAGQQASAKGDIERWSQKLKEIEQKLPELEQQKRKAEQAWELAVSNSDFLKKQLMSKQGIKDLQMKSWQATQAASQYADAIRQKRQLQKDLTKRQGDIERFDPLTKPQGGPGKA